MATARLKADKRKRVLRALVYGAGVNLVVGATAGTLLALMVR